MNRLRRDLIERRLWIVVAAMVAAVIAVPLVLHGHSNASADIVAPPTTGAGGASGVAGNGSGSSQATSDRTSARQGVSAAVRHAETTRDPFLAATTSPSSTTTTGTTATTVATTDPPASTDPTSPSTAASATSTSEAAPSSGSGATGSDPTSVETTTVTVTTTTPTTTASAGAAATPAPAGDGPWTVYTVNAAIGVTGHVTTRTNLARLTPLPSVRSPKVMFTGVLDHGHEAVFALGDGVQATGVGRCQPARAQCAAIALAAGQVEQLSWFASDGSTVTEYLAAHITPVTVHSQAAAQGAFARFSQAGQCELDLADPVAYDATRGTVSPSTTTACRGVHHAVPFPGAPNGA